MKTLADVIKLDEDYKNQRGGVENATRRDALAKVLVRAEAMRKKLQAENAIDPTTSNEYRCLKCQDSEVIFTKKLINSV